MMTKENLLKYLQDYAGRKVKGWDFSDIENMTETEALPWSYRDKVFSFLKPEDQLLDMGTGGGEFLITLRHPYAQTSVIEDWDPNYSICSVRLGSKGIRVERSGDNGSLPFEREFFDLVLNRHAFYQVDEVKRVLKYGQYFITQQVGAENNRILAEALQGRRGTTTPLHNLENEILRFKQADFRILYKNQAYVRERYMDIRAVCFYAENIPWEFPDFSIEQSIDALYRIYQTIQTQGYFESEAHRFIIIVQKRR